MVMMKVSMLTTYRHFHRVECSRAESKNTRIDQWKQSIFPVTYFSECFIQIPVTVRGIILIFNDTIFFWWNCICLIELSSPPRPTPTIDVHRWRCCPLFNASDTQAFFFYHYCHCRRDGCLILNSADGQAQSRNNWLETTNIYIYI